VYSIKMYKNRITKWGLDKRNKEAEIQAIVRKKTVRAAIGKPSEFNLRGRLVDSKKVENCLKQRSLSIVDIALQRTSSAPSPSALDFLTLIEIPFPRMPDVLQIPEHFCIHSRLFLGFLWSMHLGCPRRSLGLC
jgi:hypothetical protein